MAWGAAATGTPAATGSTGQGLSLMQESIAEIVARRGSRSSCSTWRARRATTGRRHAAAATATTAHARARADGRARGGRARRSSRSTSRDRWRNPVLLFGDYYLAHTTQSVDDRAASTSGRSRPTDWALDGSTGGTGSAAARVAARHRQAARRRRLRPRRALRGVRAGHRPRCSRASSRWSRPGSSTTPRSSSSRSARPAQVRARRGAQPAGRGRARSATCGRSRCCRSRRDARRRAPPTAPGPSPSTRTTRGR